MRTRLSDSIDISQIAVKSTATHLQLIINSLLKINEISLAFDIPQNFTSNGPVGVVEMALKYTKQSHQHRSKSQSKAVTLPTLLPGNVRLHSHIREIHCI